VSDCPARPLVSAYVDGELIGDERAAFEAHVAACEPCRVALEAERTVVATVRGVKPLPDAPAELRARVEGLLVRRPAARRTAWPAVLVAGVLLGALGVMVGSRYRSRPLAPELRAASSFASAAADVHLRYARGQLPLEVRSDQPRELSRWFAGRVPFQLTLPDYPVGPGEQKFYRLEGGRLVAFGGDYAAYIAYRMDDQPVSLLVTSADRIRPEGGEIVRSGALAFHLESVSGLKVISWTDNGLTYALASDVAVSGARTCLVCHGSPGERERLRAFPGEPGI